MPSTEVSLVLASSSPRRRELLRLFGLPFRIVPSHLSEKLPGISDPEELVRKLALAKALAVAETLGEGFVIGADTTVLVDGEMLGKPSDADEALGMLRRLMGRTHRVLTGVAVLDASTSRRASSMAATGVRMGLPPDDDLKRYASSPEPLDKAGAYAIQGAAGRFVEEIEGCFNNVVGLPLCQVAGLLKGFGLKVPTGREVCRLPGGKPCQQPTAGQEG